MLVILNNFIVSYTMGKNSSFSNNFITWEQKQKKLNDMLKLWGKKEKKYFSQGLSYQVLFLW